MGESLDRSLLKAILAYLIGVVVLSAAIVISMLLLDRNQSAPTAYQALSDWRLLAIVLAAPMALSIVTMAWSKRLEQLQLVQSKMTSELDKSRNRLDVVHRRLEEALSEKDQVKEQLLKTTTRMRLQLSRLLASGRIRQHALSLGDCIDPAKLEQLQDTFSEALNIASMWLDPSGDPIFPSRKTPAVCQLIGSTALGRQECFWFHRDLGNNAFERRKPIYKRCTACGLLCGAAPLMVDDKHLGTWNIGQIGVMGAEDFDLAAASERFGLPLDSLQDAVHRADSTTLPNFELALGLAWEITEETSERCHATLLLSKNVADRRRAEKQLRLAWHALDHSGRAFVFVGSDRECLAANEQACNLLGYKHDALKGLKLEDLFDSADSEPVLSGHGFEPKNFAATAVTCDRKKVPVKVDCYQVVVGGKRLSYMTLQPTEMASGSAGVDGNGVELLALPS
jgi:ligand-binding sensor protein